HRVLDNNWVKPNKRIFNDAKVSDHFAIIPTGTVPRSLDNNERAIFEMVTKRFVAVFFPPAQYENTTRITRVEDEPFKTKCKIMNAPGWLEVYGREGGGEKPGGNLPAVQQGERVQTTRIDINTEQTRPPVRYNEGTILSAMEAAGKLVDDEELRDAMKEKGLGTPATRASIIETLISAHYLTRHGKELQPTAKAIQTIMRFKSFTCTNEECDFTIWKTIAGRLLSRDEFEALVRDKQIGPLGGFRSRKGKRFHAALKLSGDFKTEFDFGPNGQENGAAQAVD